MTSACAPQNETMFARLEAVNDEINDVEASEPVDFFPVALCAVAEAPDVDTEPAFVPDVEPVWMTPIPINALTPFMDDALIDEAFVSDAAEAEPFLPFSTVPIADEVEPEPNIDADCVPVAEDE
jgi:hypothetical protein